MVARETLVLEGAEPLSKLPRVVLEVLAIGLAIVVEGIFVWRPKLVDKVDVERKCWLRRWCETADRAEMLLAQVEMSIEDDTGRM